MSILNKAKKVLNKDVLGEKNSPSTKKIKKTTTSTESKIIPITFDKNATKENEAILNVLNIPRHREVKVDKFLSPNDIRTYQFTMSIPQGVDIKEVDEFCQIMEFQINALLLALQRKEEDFTKLLQELNKLENKIVGMKIQQDVENLDNETDSMVVANDTIVNLRLEINELKKKVKTLERKLKDTNSQKSGFFMPKLEEFELPEVDEDITSI